MGSCEAVEPLLELLDDNNPWLRQYAAEALEKSET
ncbi:HEAT repeat domain-containing protein [Methanosarcina horonobensis]